jgi:hypothetical protein
VDEEVYAEENEMMLVKRIKIIMKVVVHAEYKEPVKIQIKVHCS